METRLSRFTEKERLMVAALVKNLNDPCGKNKNSVFARLGKYILKADSYDPLSEKNDELDSN